MKKFITLLAITSLFIGCEIDEDLNDNPNAFTDAPIGLIINHALLNVDAVAEAATDADIDADADDDTDIDTDTDTHPDTDTGDIDTDTDTNDIDTDVEPHPGMNEHLVRDKDMLYTPT